MIAFFIGFRGGVGVGTFAVKKFYRIGSWPKFNTNPSNILFTTYLRGFQRIKSLVCEVKKERERIKEAKKWARRKERY